MELYIHQIGNMPLFKYTQILTKMPIHIQEMYIHIQENVTKFAKYSVSG